MQTNYHSRAIFVRRASKNISIRTRNKLIVVNYGHVRLTCGQADFTKGKRNVTYVDPSETDEREPLLFGEDGEVVERVARVRRALLLRD